MTDRDLDVVVLGATGVTGRRVAAYLALRAPQTGARWAAAARSTDKLAGMLGGDGVAAPELIAADVGDPASLAALAARTRVVLNLVGPYTRYGRPVIEACVASGAHYVDLTGEIPFVRSIMDALDDRAREAGVKVVQVCGFEALPPDLAVLLCAETAMERHGEALAEADVRVAFRPPPGRPRASDLLSGGTLQTMAVIAGGEDASIDDPAALIADPARAGLVRARSPIRVAPRRRPDGEVLAPMAPAAYINPAVVQRTLALAAPDAPPPAYREGIVMPGGPATLPLRLGAAGVMSATQAGLSAVVKAGPGVRRRLGATMTKVLPDSGYGPAADRLEAWWWRLTAEGRTASGHEVVVQIDADGHPGYLATARMMGEAGLLLAEDGATPAGAGCLTPATALGTGCAPRLEAAQVRVSVSA